MLAEGTIIFDTDSFETDSDFSKMSGYLIENDCLDVIAGLYTKGYKELFQVNYYGVYFLKENSFKVQVCVTLDKEKDEEDIRKYYPSIAEQVVECAKSKSPVFLSLTDRETQYVFEKFKQFCLNDLKGTVFESDDFNEVIQKFTF